MWAVERHGMDHYFDERHLVLSELEQAIFEAMTKCMYCLKPFDPEKSDKVRNHEHMTGEYRGAQTTRPTLLHGEHGR